MFDKLIESNSEEAEFKNRRSYFLVSTIVVGVLFLAAVVASIYAGNIGIGNGDLEMADLLAPIETATVEPEQPQSHTPQAQSQGNETIRNSNMTRPDEPEFVPSSTSTTPNTGKSRPDFDFEIGNGPESETGNPEGIGRDPKGEPTGTGLVAPKPKVEDQTREIDPPPAIAPRATRPQSIGVVNGIATSLPKPVYPPPALAVNVQGKVDVQVMIDETGKVVSAKAVSGHPLLRGAAEKAAWSARFTPTLLSRVPVKVTGVIVYNFTKN